MPGFQLWQMWNSGARVGGPPLRRLTPRRSPNSSGLLLRFGPLIVAFFALVLAACGQSSRLNPTSASLAPQVRYVTSPSGEDVADGVFVKGVRLGGLSIAPTASGSSMKHLGLTWSQAAKLFESSVSEQGVHTNAILGFGFVSLPGSNSSLGGIKMDHRPAWVGIAWGEVTSCPAMRTSKRSGTPRRAVKPIYSAVVIYGNAGLGAFSYDSRGEPPCGGRLAGPVISPGKKVESVPWVLKSIDSAGAVRVGYSTSICARVISESASGNMKTGKFTLELDLSVPFDPKGCSTQVTKQALIPLFPPSAELNTDLPSVDIVVGHGPTGTISVLQAGKVLGEGS